MKTILMVALALLLVVPMANATYFLYEDFENYQSDWTHTGTNSLWHVGMDRAYSGSYSLAYNTYVPGTTIPTYDVGWSWGRAMTPVMDLSSASEVYFQFASWLETENSPDEYDVAYVGYSTAPIFGWNYLTPDIQTYAQGEWNILQMDLTGILAGEAHAQICFEFDSVDDMYNDYEGWYIDDVMVYDKGTPPPVPEPSTLLLLGSGLLGLGAVTRRRFRK